MTMYQRKRMSKSPYIRYDKSAGLWIQHRKVVYLYWFKSLQHAERDDRYEVDWSQYKSWGGREVVMVTKFDVWWKEHWSDLDLPAFFGPLASRVWSVVIPFSAKC